MKFDTKTLYKLYVIFILVISSVNINKSFGMEEAKDNLTNALVSMDMSIENNREIEMKQISDCLNYSKDFLNEYFKLQKFTSMLFETKFYVKNLSGEPEDRSVFDNFQQNYNAILSKIIIQPTSDTRKYNNEVKNILRYALNDIVNSVFAGTYRLLIDNILDESIYSKGFDSNEQIKRIEVSNDGTDPGQIKYKVLIPKTMALSFIRESSDNDTFLNGINFNERKQIGNRPISEKETIVKSLNLIKLNKKMNKIFFDSKRLMFQQISQQLLKTYDIDIFAVQNLQVGYISKTNTYKYMMFNYNDQIYKIWQQKKSKGVNLGFTLEIYKNTNTNKLETLEQLENVEQKSTKDTTDKVKDTKQNNFKLDENDKLVDRFFIKKYHKGTIYTKANNVDSAQSLGTKIPAITSTSFIASQTEGSKSVTNKRESGRFLDLKEPFIYKVLEQLSLGPEVHFIINPYVNRGFYIATKDISGDGYFSTIDSMEKKIKIDPSEESKSLENIKGGNTRNLSVGLSELNLFGLIYSLEDLNTGNYGHIFANKKDSEDYNQDIINTRNFKIIDFAPPCYRKDKKDRIPFNEKYKFKQNIEDIFTESYRIKFNENRFINILKKQLTDIAIAKQALSQFEDRLKQCRPNPQEEQNVEGFNTEATDEDYEAILEHLLQQQSKYIEDLMNTERGESEDEVMLRHPTETIKVNGVLRKRNRTNAELIGFKNGNAPDDVTNHMEQLQYLNNALADLATYRESIISNYRELKEYINNKYNTHYDENGELKPQFQHSNQPQAFEL